jgi:uncharacterized membrane protein
MATFTVWEFDDPTGADRAEELLESLQKQQLIQVHDAATVSWPPDRKKPKTRQSNNLTKIGALGGAFWGLLFGLLFFVPLLGAAVGAAAGALGGSLSDVGIDDGLINQIREKVTPGTSALFVLTSAAVPDRVLQAFEDSGLRPELVQSNLSSEQEKKLREAFAEAE